MALTFEITVTLDGFVTGPDPNLEQPLGAGGEALHEWIFGLRSWRERHGREGGTAGPDSDLVAESLARTGAVIMGRRMFTGGEGPWEDDPNRDSWFGDDPPFRVPVFILTHHPREPEIKQGGTTYTFVTDGIEAALEQARAAAGDKDVAIAGGPNVMQQYLRAGLLDELELHVVPLLMGDGVRLFDGLGPDLPKLERTRVLEGDAVAHLRYRVVR